MSYCVNCGVELDKTAEKCVLCDTPVLNPVEEVDYISPKPYASAMSSLQPVYRRIAAFIIGMILVAICGVCLVINLFFLETGLWFMIVLGASISIWMSSGLLLIFPGISKYLYLLCNIGAYCSTVLLIGAFMNVYGWVFRLAMPLIALAGGLLMLFIYLRKRFRLRLIGTTSVFFALIGVYTVSIELAINHYMDSTFHPIWSIIVLACCMAVVIMLSMISKTKAWKEEAKRRLRL